MPTPASSSCNGWAPAHSRRSLGLGHKLGLQHSTPAPAWNKIWKRQGQELRADLSLFFPAQPLCRASSRMGRGEPSENWGPYLSLLGAGKPWGKCSGCVFTRSRPLGAHSACPGLYAQDCPLCSACRSLAGVSPEGLTWEHVGFPGDHRTPAEAASSPRTPMMQAPTPAPPAGLLPSLESSPPGARMQQEAYRHQRNTSHQRMD